MKMARRLICVLLAALLSVIMLTLAGCGQNSEDGKADIFEGHHSEETEENTWTYYGCWKDENRQFWIIFYEDFTYEMYWGEDETGMRGKFELYGEEARLKAGPRYTPDGEGNLVNVSGDTFYPAEPPAFVYDIVFDDDYGEYDDVPAPDDERFEADESEEAAAFCGCWEYQDDDLWLCIYNDGTCEWYDAEGLYGVDTYYVEDGILYLEQEDVTYEAKFGGLIANNGGTLFSSLLPDYDGTAMNGGEDFLGCWEDAIDDVWLEINSDGTYLFMWDDGYGSAGDCSVKNKFFTLGFVAFAALQQRFCFAKPAPIPTERKLSLSESYGNLYGRRRALSGKRDALCL